MEARLVKCSGHVTVLSAIVRCTCACYQKYQWRGFFLQSNGVSQLPLKPDSVGHCSVFKYYYAPVFEGNMLGQFGAVFFRCADNGGDKAVLERVAVAVVDGMSQGCDQECAQAGGAFVEAIMGRHGRYFLILAKVIVGR